MYRTLRPLLFRLDPERAHDLTLGLLALAGVLPPLRAALRSLFCLADDRLRVRAFGLDFANQVGLAGGYDRDGRALHGLACLGFGHLELGTVTPLPQAGNAGPRLFRLRDDQALINRRGFPNGGGQALLNRLRRGKPAGVVVGVNIGKGGDTPVEEAAQDYLSLFDLFHPVADYLAVNVSSPNTVGLCALQGHALLEALLRALVQTRAGTAPPGRTLPILVKVAPDLDDGELEDVVRVVTDSGVEGIIATNTTLARPALLSEAAREQGGLSGKPLRTRSLAVVRRIHDCSSGRIPVVGVGGIFGSEDAREMLGAGATLVQVYTGLVYRGPGLVHSILQGLLAGGDAGLPAEAGCRLRGRDPPQHRRTSVWRKRHQAATPLVEGVAAWTAGRLEVGDSQHHARPELVRVGADGGLVDLVDRHPFRLVGRAVVLLRDQAGGVAAGYHVPGLDARLAHGRCGRGGFRRRGGHGAGGCGRRLRRRLD